MKWALITGASAGLGEEFAWQLAAEPLNLILVARREDRLEALASQIRAALGVMVEVLPADLSSATQTARVAARLADPDRPVGLLVNNAGFATGQVFAGGDLEAEQRCLDVLVRSTMVLTHAAIPAMKAHGGGAIINVGSVAAGTAMGTYAAHKTWVRAFSEAVATELRGSSVSVTCVNPGPMATEFFSAAGLGDFAAPDFTFVAPAQVVAEAIEAARRRQVLVTPTWLYRASNALVRVAPRWLVRRVTASEMFNKQARAETGTARPTSR